MNKNRKNKALAAVLATSILVTGTFAWQSFSQLATNETITEGGLAGGRLHNYFYQGNDEDITKVQEVFVENYAGIIDLDTDENAVNPNEFTSDIYARVRISEYLEYGVSAGYIDGETPANAKDVTIVRGDKSQIEDGELPKIDDETTWDIYTYGSTANSQNIRTYRDLVLGDVTKSTIYLPTFNQDHQDTTADINGTLGGEGKDRTESDRHDDNAYADYVKYETTTPIESVLSFYDEVSGSATTTEEYEHTPQPTLSTKEVISMAEWLALDDADKIDARWVFDTDGWAYWTQPIEEKSATGLLLSGIDEVKTLEGTTTYYAVHVEAELATAGDWGTATEYDEDGETVLTDPTGMYQGGMTGNAKYLLDCVSDVVVARKGLAQTLGVPGSSITGLVGTSGTIEIGGVDFYVIDVDTKTTYSSSEGDDPEEIYGVFLMTASPWENQGYYFNQVPKAGYESSYWASSDLRVTLEEEILKHEELLAVAKYVDTTVEPFTNTYDVIDTYDRFFPLSSTEFNDCNLAGTAAAKDSAGHLGGGYQMRSLRDPSATTFVYGINAGIGEAVTNGNLFVTNSVAVRPAMWVVL